MSITKHNIKWINADLKQGFQSAINELDDIKAETKTLLIHFKTIRFMN